MHSLGVFSASSYGTAMETSIVGIQDCQKLKDASVAYYNHRHCEESSSSSVPLKYPLYLVRDDFRNVVATTWKHDEELGRGFLLISTSYGTGKIWQWETGGGPIPIGKTLHMIHSGCRSNNFRNCTDSDVAVGSGGVIVDKLHEPQRLIVAEWGEGRIVRLEENGARTPLIIQVPVDKPAADVRAEIEDAAEDNETATNAETEEDTPTRRLAGETDEDKATTTDSDNEEKPETEENPDSATLGSEPEIEEVPVATTEIMHGDPSPLTRRLERPSKLLLTPFADLLVLDSSNGDDYLWQLPQIHKIPGLESLSISRKAHAWDHLMYNATHTRGITIGSTSSGTPKDDEGMPQKLLQSSHLGGMALVPKNWLQLYVTMKQGDSVVVVTLALEDEEEDSDDDDDVVTTKESKSKSERQSSIYLDYSQYASKPGPIEIDENGNLYVVVDHGILIVSSTGAILGTIATDGLSIVDMTLGEDRFLYLATETKLYRLRLRNKNLSVPTDIVKQK